MCADLETSAPYWKIEERKKEGTYLTKRAVFTQTMEVCRTGGQLLVEWRKNAGIGNMLLGPGFLSRIILIASF